MQYLITLCLLPIFMNQLYTQNPNLSKHRWKDRLVIILADSPKSPKFLLQLEELKQKEEGLNERKIFVYRVLPDQFTTGLEEGSSWRESTQFYNSMSVAESSFEVVLIGLDGGVKLRRVDPLSCEDLFSIIDGMPMRKAEIKRKNKL